MALEFGNKVENQGTTPDGKLTAGEFNLLVEQVNKNTPIQVDSEDSLKEMIENGSIVPGQVYFIAEDEEED